MLIFNGKRTKIVVVLTVLINVIGMGIIIPVLPHYVESFGLSPFGITLLFSVFSFFAFLSGPLLGSLSDKLGRRPMLILSIASTAVGWLTFTLAGNIFFLFLGRIIDGMAAGNISIAQSSLVDVAKDQKERTKNLGLIGVAFGLGFILGPLFGGVLSSYSIRAPFWFATVLAFIDLALAYFLLPETNQNMKRNKKISLNPLTPLRRSLFDQKLFPGFLAWFFFILSAMGMQSIFALFLDRVYHYGPLASGIFMTVMGAIIALNQLVGLKHFWLKYFSEPKIEFWMLLITACGYFLMGIKLFSLFVFGLLIISFGQSVLRAVMNSQMVGLAPKERHGEVLGNISSVMSLAMILGPIASGAVFVIRPFGTFYLSGFFTLVAFGIIFFNQKKLEKTPSCISG